MRTHPRSGDLLNLNQGTTGADLDRRVRFTAAFNFRDLGGYRCHNGKRTRWRRVFRSGALHWMTHEDALLATDELSIRGVLDLRDSLEVERDGRAPFVGPETAYHHVPILDGSQRVSQQAQDARAADMAAIYLAMLENGGTDFGRAISVLAGLAREPVVFHCAAGKDRTGLLAALVLGVVGVPDELIVEDYALTAQHMEPIIERMRRSPGYSHIVKDLPAGRFHPQPDAMERALAGIRSRWGSIRAYVLAQGVSDGDLVQLETGLVE